MKKILLGIFCLVAISAWSIAQEVIEDFEGSLIPLNQLSNGPLPNDSLVAVENPAPDDVDSSDYVLKFRRSSAGDVWAGFWSELPSPVDLTTNKWVSVKVWKPRLSVVKFKVEGGTTNPTYFELASVRPQTKTSAWEELVFHFPGATGTYPKIAVLVDFKDPVGLTDDIVCYLDDITFWPSDPGAATVINTPENDDFIVYPNPVLENLYIENLKDVKSISIYSLTGQKLLTYKGKISSSATMNVSSLSGGVYMLSVENATGNSTIKKFVKE